MYLKNLTYFVQLSTRKDDFCLVKYDKYDKYFAHTRESESESKLKSRVGVGILEILGVGVGRLRSLVTTTGRMGKVLVNT